MPKALEKQIRIPKGFNSVEVRSDTLDMDDRTVEVIWSTGAKVKRYSWDEGYYMEELSMDPKAIRLDRFTAGMSLLDSHTAYSMENRLGTVVPGSVRVENGKAYAKIKFSRKQMAEEILQDIRDGHAVQISVGYKTHRYEKTTSEEGELPVYRAIDWEPMELSCVPVPADPGAYSRSESSESFDCVLVGQDDTNAARSASTGVKHMNKRDAAKSYKGDQLDALAIGAGLSRNENETDEALRKRLLEAYDAEDAQKRQAEEDEQKRSEDKQRTDAEAKRKADEEAARKAAENADKPLTAADAKRIASEAQATERKRTADINELARTANFSDEAFIRQHVDSGATVDQFRTALFDKLVERQAANPTFPHVETRGMQDADTTRRSLVANAILHRHGVVKDLKDGAGEWRDMPALDVAKELLRARGERTVGSPNEIVTRALHTTSDFPAILGEVTRQTLVAGYSGYENTFQLFANRNVVSDFREIKMLEIGKGPELKKVNEHGEFTRGTLKESEEAFKIDTFGRVFGLTRQMIINDQLNAFVRVVQGWGMQAAKLEGDIVWGVIIDNMKLKDGKGIFHADHKNLGTAAPLSQAALEAARAMFRKQKDIDGEPINIAPQYLFVGSDLEILAQKLITGITVPNQLSQVVPEAIRSLTPVYEYRLDKISATVFFLFASQQATMGRGVQYAYLSGQEQPFFDERVGFDVDGIEYKIRHDFGAGVTDYRFAYKNDGAAQPA